MALSRWQLDKLDRYHEMNDSPLHEAHSLWPPTLPCESPSSFGQWQTQRPFLLQNGGISDISNTPANRFA
jgi:hypothetical protein